MTSASTNSETGPPAALAGAAVAVAEAGALVEAGAGVDPAATPLAVELKLLKAVPQKYRLHAHHWLILHGRYICLARKPRCAACPIVDLCEFKQKTEPL